MTRTEIINKLIKDNNYHSYLEIGMDNPFVNFTKIQAQNKVSVDPFQISTKHCTHWDNNNIDEFLKYLTHRLTSDDFFSINNDKFDIIFIDGLHLEHQVDKDIFNSLKFFGTVLKQLQRLC